MASDPTAISWQDVHAVSRAVLRRWRWPLPALVVLLALVAAAWGYDQRRGTVITNGVHAGPIKLGGLSPGAAQRRLGSVIARHQRGRVQLIVGDQRLTVVPAKLGVGLDVNAMAARAVKLG